MQNADNLEYCDSGLIHIFFKTKRGMLSSFISCCSMDSLGVQKLRGKHVFRNIEIIQVLHIESSEPKNEILWTSVIQALSRQFFQMCAAKIQYRQATGYWNF